MPTTRPTALITGASSGIGKCFSQLCAANGYDLVLAARNIEALQQTADEIKKSQEAPIAITLLPCDLSDANSAQEIVDSLRSRGINVDLLINNAGSGIQGDFANADIAALMQLVNLNVVTLTHLTRLLIPGMLLRGSGKILNVASIASYYPGPLTAAYNASKAYVLSLSEALHFELRDAGVIVSVLCPGPTESNFGARAGLSACPAFQRRLMDAHSVAKAGLDGLHKGKRVVVPGWANQLRMIPIRLTPRAILARFSRQYHLPQKSKSSVASGIGSPSANSSPPLPQPMVDGAMLRNASASRHDYAA